MRKIIAFVLLFSFCLGAAGCGDYFTWRKYYDKENKFSLKIPKVWEIDEDNSHTPEAALIINIPNQDPTDNFASSVRVVVEELPSEIPLSTYYDINREEFKQVFKKMGDVTEGQGMNGIYRHQWIAFNALLGDKLVIRAISCLWMKGKRVYVLTCVMGLKSADKIEPLFRKMITSFRLH